MNALEARKQILIAESELNRAHLIEEIAAMKEGVGTLTHRAAALGPVTSSAAVLATGLAAFRRGQLISANARPSTLQRILNIAVLASIVWRSLRTQPRMLRKGSIKASLKDGKLDLEIPAPAKPREKPVGVKAPSRRRRT